MPTSVKTNCIFSEKDMRFVILSRLISRASSRFERILSQTGINGNISLKLWPRLRMYSHRSNYKFSRNSTYILYIRQDLYLPSTETTYLSTTQQNASVQKGSLPCETNTRLPQRYCVLRRYILRGENSLMIVLQPTRQKIFLTFNRP